MPDTTRVLKITGEALKGMGSVKRSTRKATPEKEQHGGYDTVPPPAMPTPSQTPMAKLIPDVAPIGGARKLQLAPKKEVLKLVKKTPAKEIKEAKEVKEAEKPKSKTRKVIRIQMGHLRKSMKRASDITKSSKEKSIEDIEDLLIREKILRKRSTERPMSEGRQQTLRGMYRDYVQLRSNLM
jgi:hypothetical protein